MRIIHCADLHLDSALTSVLPKEKASKRREELLMAFQNMLKYACGNRVDAVLIVGDLFDTNRISAHARNIVAESIRNCPETEFYYLKGNHDSRDEFVGSLKNVPDNLHLFGNEWTSYLLHDGRRQIRLYGLELGNDNSALAASSLTVNPGDFNIVMLHGQESEHAAKDRAEVIGIRGFRGKGIDYMALGHIHQYKKEALDTRGTYCYSGALEGRGFDETGDHGFVLLDINEEDGTYESEFVPFAARKVWEIDADISGEETTFAIEKCIRSQLAEYEVADNSLVKIVLTGETDVEGEKNLSYLESVFEDEYFFVKIQDKTTIRVDYESFARDVSLKGEFIRTVRESDIPEDEKAAVIRLGLQALAGGEL